MNQRRRIRVGIVFGGRSGEHEVSLRSAESVMAALDTEKYEIVPIGLTRQGGWLPSGDPMRALKAGAEALDETAIVTNPRGGGLVTVSVSRGVEARPALDPIDVIFPVLHGPYGEDGAIQGLLEMANVPYVGAGVLGSALGMDKAMMKTVLRAAGLPVLDWVAFIEPQWRSAVEQTIVEIEARLGYPCFVKPANLGSSVGITRATDEPTLREAVDLALTYDRKVIVEQAAIDAREVECSVLGNDAPIASVVGEVIPDREWYDYDAKYANSATQLLIPAPLSAEASDRVRALAVGAFRAIDCAGMARVDFFISRDESIVLVNELNTIPGFTNISMYPKLWEASGLSYGRLLDRLIELAIERHEGRSRLRTDR